MAVRSQVKIRDCTQPESSMNPMLIMLEPVEGCQGHQRRMLRT